MRGRGARVKAEAGSQKAATRETAKEVDGMSVKLEELIVSVRSARVVVVLHDAHGRCFRRVLDLSAAGEFLADLLQELQALRERGSLPECTTCGGECWRGIAPPAPRLS